MERTRIQNYLEWHIFFRLIDIIDYRGKGRRPKKVVLLTECSVKGGGVNTRPLTFAKKVQFFFLVNKIYFDDLELVPGLKKVVLFGKRSVKAG